MCIYCNNKESEHFCCEICGVGMCEDCYNADIEHDKHYNMPCEVAENDLQANKIIKACGGREPDYLCQNCIDQILGSEMIEVKSSSFWKIIETRRYIGQNKTMWSSSWDLCNGSIIVASYGKLKYALEEFELIINNKTSEGVSKSLINALITEIESNGIAQFSYQGYFYDVFDSSEGGYQYSYYPDDIELIFDDDGELIDDEVLDGGYCESEDAISVLSFIFPKNLLFIAPRVVDTIEITANKTIDVLSSGLAYYNYQGNHFRLFASKNDALRYIESEDESLIIKEFNNEEELDSFLSNPSLH